MTIFGTLDIRDYDLGCMLTIGATVIHYTLPNNEGTRAHYVIDIPAVNSELARFENKIPVFFDNPSDPYQDYIIPSIVFKQNSFNDAFSRMPYVHVEGRGPASNAQELTIDGVHGYSHYETQVRGDPYDISYDMNIYARRRQELNAMLGHIMRIMKPPSPSFKVKDSLGDVRYYDTSDLSYSNNSELADIADRTMTWTISFTVRADIDTFDGICSPAMIDPEERYSTI